MSSSCIERSQAAEIPPAPVFFHLVYQLIWLMHPPVSLQHQQGMHRSQPRCHPTWPLPATLKRQSLHTPGCKICNCMAVGIGSNPSTTAEAVLVRDGELVPAPATAQLLLSQHRGWSYTAAIARCQYHVIDWELHVERLIRNMEVLAQQRPPAYAGFLEWQQQQQQAAGPPLQELVNPMVAAALQRVAQQPAAADSPRVMLTVVLGDKPGPEVGSSSDTPPLSVWVWAKPVAPAAASPGKVLVAGDPRPTAAAKHCDWVMARQPLEQTKQQAGVDEVLLSDSSGALLEGLVSNFFVVADAAQLDACGQAVSAAAVQQAVVMPDPGSTSHEQATGLRQDQAMLDQQSRQQTWAEGEALQGLVVLTTGPRDDALLGITQQRVLQACQELKLPVVLQPARLDSVHAWREAFLTNCFKGLQPVQEVRLSNDKVWVAGSTATVVQLLQQEVCRLQVTTDMQRWLKS